MGQYYKIIMKKDGKETVYSRDIINKNGEKEYMVAKLTEHSWIGNEFVDAIANRIYNSKHPCRVIWIGDYAINLTDSVKELNISKEELVRLYKMCWSDETIDNGKPIRAFTFDYDNKFLVNHDEKVYMDFKRYLNSCSYKDKYNDWSWCLNPISILTCVGNGLGGGDYRYPTENSTFDLVGTWAYDRLSITNEEPTKYKEIFPIFLEKQGDVIYV